VTAKEGETKYAKAPRRTQEENRQKVDLTTMSGVVERQENAIVNWSTLSEDRVPLPRW